MRFRSREEITEYVRRSYASQDASFRRTGVSGATTGELPLGVAEPDVLIEEAIRLSEPEGITDAVLRRVVPVGKERFERGLWRLREAERIRRTKERRHDRRGSLREQVIWHLLDAE